MLLLGFLLCFQSDAWSEAETALAARMAEKIQALEPQFTSYNSAVSRYEKDMLAVNRAMNNLNSLTEQYKGLDAKYAEATKYTSQSGELALKRNDLQTSMRQTATIIEQLTKEAHVSLERATTRANTLMRAAYDIKFADSTSKVASQLKSALARQILYLQNGVNFKQTDAHAIFRGVQATENMPKVSRMGASTEQTIEIKAGSETRSMKLRAGDYMLMKTTNDGISRVQIQGFTPEGRVVVKDSLAPAIRGMSSMQPFVVDFEKIAEVSVYKKGNGTLDAQISKDSASQRMRIRWTNGQRFNAAQLNQWERFRSPQMGNNPSTLVAPKQTTVGAPGTAR